MISWLRPFAAAVTVAGAAPFLISPPSFAQARVSVTGAPSPEAATSAATLTLHGNGHYIYTVDGRLYYETEGSGPPIFLVAGGPGGSHASFHPYFSSLAATHTVVYFDNIGRGRSDRLSDPTRYTIERDADDIEALRKALHYDRISILGHSYGGLPAVAYALKHPKHVDRLILSDTLHCAAAWQEGTDSTNLDASARYPERWARLTEMRARGMKTCAEEYENLYTTCTADLYWFDPRNAATMAKIIDPQDRYNFDIYRAMCGEEPEWQLGGTMKGYDPRSAMAGLHMPILICVGRFDRVALPKVAFEMKGLLPLATSTLVVFDLSGHRPWIEESTRYFQVVSDFLAGTSVAALRVVPNVPLY